MTFEQLLIVCSTFVVGGVFKGAIGVGAPLIAIPVMAIIVDVPFAAAVFLVPNIVSNTWQSWRFRKYKPEGYFSQVFAIFGFLGAGVGTMLLVKFSSLVLTTTIALIILIYVAFKVRNPSWTLKSAVANKLVIPLGTIGGFLQGSTGLSAPISVTFMSAVNLRRKEFIFTMSFYFFVMTIVQFPVQIYLEVMNWERFFYGVAAVIPLSLGMYAGDFLGQRLHKSIFDKAIIALLLLLSLRLLFSNFISH